MKKQTFGVIVTTRGFFPSHLVKTAREKIANVLDSMGYGYVMVSEKDTEHGAVVSYEESKICAKLFQKNKDIIDGIIVILPNFGEELGVADAVEMANLDVPVLVQACDDDWIRWIWPIAEMHSVANCPCATTFTREVSNTL